MKEIRLFTPGPTPVPGAIRDAGAKPIIHHRSEEFGVILQSVREKLAWLCDTDGETLILASSGSGGMEATVTSLFQEGDEVVVVEGGKFGERWVQLAQHYGLKANILKVPWGKRVSAEDVLSAVTLSTKGVLMQGSETSTGVFHPIDEIGAKLPDQKDLLFVVDGITALGVHDLSMKRDRLDVLIGGSQKAFMCPPGLATVALSQRAVARLDQVRARGFYFSLSRELKAQKKASTAFTPAISLVCSLDAALVMMQEEGKEALFRRQRLLQKMARSGLRADGFQLFNADEDAAWGLTAVCAPEGMDAKKWIKELRVNEGLWLAGGQNELDGKIFRVSHMGACWPKDLLGALETIEASVVQWLPAAKHQEGSKVAKQVWEQGV